MEQDDDLPHRLVPILNRQLFVGKRIATQLETQKLFFEFSNGNSQNPNDASFCK